MDFRKYVNKDKPNKKVEETKIVESEDVAISNNEYYEMLNPDTGLRYDIPMLSRLAPDYYYKYIHYMKLRERSPETFKKIISWD